MKRLYTLVVCLVVVGLMLGTFATGAQAKAVTKIKIAGGRVGDPWYVLSEALAYFLNHNSKWLRATVVATPGITGNYEMGMKYPKDYVFVAEMGNFIHMAKDPYGKRFNYYNKTRFISIQCSLTYTWVTYDKNIKSGKDVAGKKVNIKRKAAPYFTETGILRHWGVLDKVKLVHAGMGGTTKNLKDGLVDVGHMTFDHIYPAGFGKGVFITDMETRAPIYYISTSPEIVKAMVKEGIAADIAVRIPPGALDRKTQKKEVWCHAAPLFVAADARMDPAIVHEVTRVIWESAGKWDTWHPQGKHMNKDFIPAMPMEFKYCHPGAKKFYDEHGIKLRKLGDLLH